MICFVAQKNEAAPCDHSPGIRIMNRYSNYFKLTNTCCEVELGSFK
jgi:hypothetical protein